MIDLNDKPPLTLNCSHTDGYCGARLGQFSMQRMFPECDFGTCCVFNLSKPRVAGHVVMALRKLSVQFSVIKCMSLCISVPSQFPFTIGSSGIVSNIQLYSCSP